MSDDSRYAALLRGINVGRSKRIPMAELRAALEAAGFGDVRTVLQSGNIALDASGPADPGSEASIAHRVSEVVHDSFGVDARTVVRSRADILAVVDRNPLAEVATEPSRYVVYFLEAAPRDDLQRHLRDIDPGDDRFAVEGRELYLWCPHGQLDSPLAKALDRIRPAPLLTARNWSTVGKLAAVL